MTSVIGFMTSTLFCRTTCWKCDGWLDCPRLSPHDEANCPQPCSSSSIGPIPCPCNKPLGNMTCEKEGQVCYSESGKLLVLFYFCKRHND